MATEKRLIDANALKKAIRAESWKQIRMVQITLDFIDLIIGEQPTVDAVEVVRCKDCKNYWKNVNTPGYSGKCTTVNDDEFCEQVRWERDVAIEQLESYGVSLGEKAEVAKVVHGRWIHCENGGYNCSNCDRRVAFLVHNRYCPNCGAKMDGDGNG